MPNLGELDHLVYGVPDLLSGVRQFAEDAGVEPVVGGRHAGLGTANYLVRLGAYAYLEIIGPDPQSPGAPTPYLFGVDTLTTPALLTWCVRTEDIDHRIALARSQGYDPGDAIGMSRVTRTGDVLSWRLTPNTIQDTSGTVPCLIDWGQSTHPTASDLPQLELAEFAVLSPSVDITAGQLDALGVSLAVEYSSTAHLRAVLDTPNGRLTLT